ncbi:hypothetical protein F2Q70_00034843 [Brassica cretica]|uniref:ER membrane protein complex subunit 3 n=1 Tax=Brassica cretica TaxID=69181 RepID=A0A8S9JX51_BRACR|nr:hypothetical protein F2Q70_00034843 [Brassica cretica]
MAEDLVLDTAIRDWVLIPLSVVMVLIGVLRYFVSKLMRSSPTPDAKMVKEGQVVIRARNLKAGANFIPPKSFRARRFYFSNEENGLLHVPKDQAQNPQAQMFSDPNMAMDMMKKNLSMIIPQTLTFAWVNFFFSGFVAAKIPFPLTQRFRSMLQNGIDLSTVDVSYVSSRSWYFLNLFGLRGLFSLILGDENAIDDTQRMMQMGGFGFDASKMCVKRCRLLSHWNEHYYSGFWSSAIDGLSYNQLNKAGAPQGLSSMLCLSKLARTCAVPDTTAYCLKASRRLFHMGSPSNEKDPQEVLHATDK